MWTAPWKLLRKKYIATGYIPSPWNTGKTRCWVPQPAWNKAALYCSPKGKTFDNQYWQVQHNPISWLEKQELSGILTVGVPLWVFDIHTSGCTILQFLLPEFFLVMKLPFLLFFCTSFSVWLKAYIQPWLFGSQLPCHISPPITPVVFFSFAGGAAIRKKLCRGRGL